jgi:quercetin dioxygenase-like cupin family protein
VSACWDRPRGTESWYVLTIAPGGRLGTHSTPGEAVCFQIEGTATLELPSGAHADLTTGDVLLVGDDVRHSFRNGGEHASLTAIARLGPAAP